MTSVMIAEYLSEKEAASLSERLQAEGRGKPIVKRHGLPRLFGVDASYRIFVDAADREPAKKIAGEFLAECDRERAELRARLAAQCPRCSSREVFAREKTSWWLRFRFFGVSVWRCRACGNEWYT